MQLLEKTGLDSEFIERVHFIRNEYPNRHRAVIARTVYRVDKGELECKELFPILYVLSAARLLGLLAAEVEQKLLATMERLRQETFGKIDSSPCLRHIDCQVSMRFDFIEVGRHRVVLTLPPVLKQTDEDVKLYLQRVSSLSKPLGGEPVKIEIG